MFNQRSANVHLNVALQRQIDVCLHLGFTSTERLGTTFGERLSNVQQTSSPERSGMTFEERSGMTFEERLSNVQQTFSGRKPRVQIYDVQMNVRWTLTEHIMLAAYVRRRSRVIDWTSAGLQYISRSPIQALTELDVARLLRSDSRRRRCDVLSTSFPSGHPSKFWLGSKLLDFGDRTGPLRSAL